MILGLWADMRKRREEKKKELERIAAEKRELSEDRAAAAWVQLEKAKEELRQKRYAEHLASLKVSSLDQRREQMQGTLTARRAYLVDSSRNPEMTDSNMIAAQQFIQSIQESASSSCDTGSSNTSSSSDCGSSDSGCGSCGSD